MSHVCKLTVYSPPGPAKPGGRGRSRVAYAETERQTWFVPGIGFHPGSCCVICRPMPNSHMSLYISTCSSTHSHSTLPFQGILWRSCAMSSHVSDENAHKRFFPFQPRTGVNVKLRMVAGCGRSRSTVVGADDS